MKNIIRVTFQSILWIWIFVILGGFTFGILLPKDPSCDDQIQKIEYIAPGHLWGCTLGDKFRYYIMKVEVLIEGEWVETD